MSQPELLTDVTSVLNALGIEFHADPGSHASSLQSGRSSQAAAKSNSTTFFESTNCKAEDCSTGRIFEELGREIGHRRHSGKGFSPKPNHS